jgi:hypothetical protein
MTSRQKEMPFQQPRGHLSRNPERPVVQACSAFEKQHFGVSGRDSIDRKGSGKDEREQDG